MSGPLTFRIQVGQRTRNRNPNSRPIDTSKDGVFPQPASQCLCERIKLDCLESAMRIRNTGCLRQYKACLLSRYPNPGFRSRIPATKTIISIKSVTSCAFTWSAESPPLSLSWRWWGALVRFLGGNLVLGSFHARFCAFSNRFAGTTEALAHSLACGDWMSFLHVMSCRLGAASNVTRRGGHDLAATDAQMRQPYSRPVWPSL